MKTNTLCHYLIRIVVFKSLFLSPPFALSNAYFKELSVRKVAVGMTSTCALLDDHSLKCWGRNFRGELGQGHSREIGGESKSMGNTLPRTQLKPGMKIKEIVAGGYHFCAILENQGVQCWGSNSRGQLGLGDLTHRGFRPGQMGDNLPFVDLGSKKIKSLELGEEHGCTVFIDGTMKCWGSNIYGQLGLGDTKARGDNPNEMGNFLPEIRLGNGTVVESACAGGYHTCALLSNGSVKCWGINSDGQLGQEDLKTRGISPSDMGDNLPTTHLGASKAVSLTCGNRHTCVTLENGKLKCWGFNHAGQLGLGDDTSRGSNKGDMGEMLPAVELDNELEVKNASCGYVVCCVVLSNNAIKCWGYNDFGVLGLGDTNSRGDEPNEMGKNLPYVDLGRFVSIEQVSIGVFHTCALTKQGKLKCWGWNEFSALGLEDKIPRGYHPLQMGDNLPYLSFGSVE